MAGVLILTTFSAIYEKYHSGKENGAIEFVKYQFDNFKLVGSILLKLMNGKLK